MHTSVENVRREGERERGGEGVRGRGGEGEGRERERRERGERGEQQYLLLILKCLSLLVDSS